MLVKDYTGQVINNRRVVRFIGRDKQGNAVWSCECCKCNKRTRLRISTLRKRRCLYCSMKGIAHPNKRKDHSGRIINNRRILSYAGKNKYGKSLWNYECLKCGRSGRNRIGILKTRRCKKCSTGGMGCRPDRYLGCGDINQAFYLRLLRASKHRKRPVEFLVSPEYLWALFLQQGGRCGLSGRPIKLNPNYVQCGPSLITASLDRIDSSKGYIPGNVWWIHKDFQSIKMAMSIQELVNVCKEVVAHQCSYPQE